MKSPLRDRSPFLSRRQALLLGLSGISSLALGQESTATSGVNNASSEDWASLRAQLTLNPRWAYFDTATAGPATRAVLAAEYRALEASHADEQEFYAARYNPQAVRQFCNRIASWMNCSGDEVTMTRGAHAGLEQFADGFNFQPSLLSGDELVLCNQLPPSAITFWTRWARQRGMSIKTVMLPSPLLNTQQAVESFSAALSSRSRVMVFSHVQYTDGAILPVRELCRLAHERNVLSVVDGTLVLGAMQISVADMGCDVYAASFSHWMNGPLHTGVLYMRRELHAQLPYQTDAMIEMLDLNTPAWPSLVAKLPRDFLHYAPQFQALPAALSLQENLGRSIIAARIHELSSYARLQLQSANMRILTPIPGEMWNNILTISISGRNAVELVNYLRRTDQLMIGGMNLVTGAVLRFSFHIYNSFDDIDRLMRGLTRLLKAG